MQIVSSTVGSPTNTGWKRRCSAASFSTYFWYSSSVVAPMQCSSPRASAGLSRLPASIAPSRSARADQRVHLVDEQDDVALGALHLVEHGLEPLLELAAVFRAGDQAAHVERHQLAVLEAVGHVAVGDAQREAFGDRGLADAGLADQDRVVLGPAGEDLHGAADFLVAADHGIELARLGHFGEVAGVFAERVVGFLRAGGVRLPPAAQVGDRCLERLGGEARRLQRLPRSGGRRQRQREQHALDGDVAVAALGRGLLGLVEHAHRVVVEARGRLRAAARNRGDLAQRGVDPLHRHRRDCRPRG